MPDSSPHSRHGLGGEIDRLRNEVSRRDAVLHWIAENMPGTLELCPYKLADNPASTSALDGALRDGDPIAGRPGWFWSHAEGRPVWLGDSSPASEPEGA